MKTITVVTPVYNEDKNIEIVYEKVKKVFNEIDNVSYKHLFIDNDSIDKSLGIANERTHWVLPSSNNSKGRDVILYRADVHRFYSSVRSWSDGNPPTQQDWSSPQVHFELYF